MVSWQERMESKAPRRPCGSEVGLPLPHSPLQLMSQVFRLLRSHSSLPAKLFCRLKLVTTDSSLLALRWRNCGKYLKHAAPGMCKLPFAGLGRGPRFLS